MSLYVHVEEKPVHEWRGGVSPLGYRWNAISDTLALDTFELITRLRNFPENPELIMEAVELAKRAFEHPISIPVNHFNAQSIIDLKEDCIRVMKGESRLYSIDTIFGQMEPDDPDQRDKLSTKCVGFKPTPYGIAMWASRGVQGVVDMLCVISTLSKLLQK